MEGLGGVPGPSWRGLGASGGDFGQDFLAMKFKDVFLIQKGRSGGGILEAFREAKWFKNRYRNSRAKKEALERDLASIWELLKRKK